MKTLLFALLIVASIVKQTESTKGVYYPNVNETECFTDTCLGELVYPQSAYNGEAF